MAIVALLTDFGTTDYYVAAMKGSILQVDPKATLVDISHDIPSQDVYHAAFVLRQVLPCFPAKTIFTCVVDPGVGTSRRILAARYSDRVILAPDNGLLTLVHRDADLQEVRTVENRRFFASTLSSTFHGRDIFAPVAGHLSKGVALDHLGPVADRIEILNLAKPVRHPDGSMTGEVQIVDRFGNLITNISVLDLSAARAGHRQLQVSVKGVVVGPLRITYGDVPPGELVALIGSSQMLEIGVNQGSAAERLGARRGDPVQVC
ncbi:MAG TPA: SAM-dependent chlorinase/fluorinase [Phycisphaerae bacterium]|nr:SAM-dependent chlorinase/fluorinase [Phycisphaerae bacterium]HOJ76263.1 SAM-dependent chlorinase/fluorinase [Phycisphaerae bacterium]HOM53629.1 SAM-dependent chlorinase/fluorinase [Phycisphaerae bacterium]HON68373.1 SAM-dependent chlorinase/fluorinase [Phycisphaerae bacterium]HOQ86061.1 SAM-dependent chlorinase/fluorinase [Phycisphaerae bacterium]